MTRAIKYLIWTYVVLLITEGALRKWILPGHADALLIVRDPVVVLIYGLALMGGIFPRNGFIVAIGILTIASIVSSYLAGLTNEWVILYGLRINYFHLPLIWIMGEVLNRRDVERLGTFVLLAAIPMTLIMVQQFRSPMMSWINKGVGTEEGGQLFGVDGRIRPPGLFAFITGPQVYFPFCAAFFFDQLKGHGRMKWPFLVACGIAIVIALPVSISRTVMLATGMVGAAFVITAPFAGGVGTKLFRPILLMGILGLIVTRLPIFHEGSSVFQMRWETAAVASDGDGWADVTDRIVNTVLNPFYFALDASLFGHGIGVGSNVGARLLSGEAGFLLAEEEYGKIYGELGVLVGTGFIALRLSLAAFLGWRALRALREHQDALPLLLFSAACVLIINGQWAPPTILGFAVVGSGLLLGALNPAQIPVPVLDSGPREIEMELLPEPGLPLASPLRLPFVRKTVSLKSAVASNDHKDRH